MAVPEPAGGPRPHVRRRGARAAWAAAALVVALAGVLGALALRGAGADPAAGNLALWRIVADGCGPAGAGAAQGGTPPGLQCQPGQGAALLKDRCGARHFLLIPTARRRGVESPELLDPREPNYFALAWEQRARAQGGADDAVGLAVNSRYGRSQEQLHIHIDRLRPELVQALRTLPARLPADATLAWRGHVYRVSAQDGLVPSPFAVAAGLWGAQTQAERARITIAVVAQPAASAPAAPSPGRFLVLSGRADPWHLDRGHAEELLVDHPCP